MHKYFKKLLFIFALFIFGLLFSVAVPVLAQLTPSGFEDTLVIATQTDIPTIIANIINVALGFLGIVAVIIVLYGGFAWMTSGGNDENVAKAKKILINGAIGLGLVLGAFVIAQFIFRVLLGVGGGEAVPSAAPPAAAVRVGGGALGSGIVESHYPTRGQTGVARNTKILITFKEPIDPSSIADSSVADGNLDSVCAGSNAGATAKYVKGGKVYYCEVSGNKKFVPGLTLKTNAIQIIKTVEMGNSVRESNTANYVGAGVSFTSDLRTWVITPTGYLGSATDNVSYKVYLCGTKLSPGNCFVDPDTKKPIGIKLFSGVSAFAGRFNDYEWSFETGTYLDLTPPTISSVVPIFDNEKDAVGGAVKDRKDKPRNTIIQINFSEPVLPTVSSGKTVLSGESVSAGAFMPGTFNVLRVINKDTGSYLAGTWAQGNQYKTSEFISIDKCGQNSCGQNVFCLPGPNKIAVEARTASLANPAETNSFKSAGTMDGLEDLAGNVMDGKKDGVAKGPSGFYNLNDVSGLGDSVQWSFWTAPYIDLTSPIMEITNPGIHQPGVPLNQTIEMTFSKPMSITTLNSRNIDLSGQEINTAKPWDSFWSVGAINIDSNADGEVEKTTAIINQGGFWEVSNYQSLANQNVKDIYQNCFYPSGGQSVCSGLTSDRPYCCNGQPSADKCF